MRRPPLLLPCCVLLLSIASAPAPAERFELDPDHSVVAFTIGHVGFSNVLGRFTEVGGGFDYDEDRLLLENLVVTVGTASVDTDHAARDEHVRKADFLDVKRHPEMVFRVERATLRDGDGGPVEGTLELLGTTLPLTLEVSVNRSADYPFGHERYTHGISASGTLARSDYGMDYGVANGLVGDEVTLIIETEAPRAE